MNIADDSSVLFYDKNPPTSELAYVAKDHKIVKTVQFTRKRKIILVAIILVVATIVAVTVYITTNSNSSIPGLNSSKDSSSSDSNQSINSASAAPSSSGGVDPVLGDVVRNPLADGAVPTPGDITGGDVPPVGETGGIPPPTGGIPPPTGGNPPTGTTSTTGTTPPPPRPQPPAAVLPAAGLVYFGTITNGGSGCPQGSVSQTFSSDRTTFSLLFDAYVASVGPLSPLTSARKNCQLNIQIVVPPGWQYSMTTIDYRGYANLDAGVTAEQSVTYYFQGQKKESSKITTSKGPMDKSYVIRDQFPTSTKNWSPCNQSANLNINTAIDLFSDSVKAEGLLTTDSLDGQIKVAQQFGLVWQKC